MKKRVLLSLTLALCLFFGVGCNVKPLEIKDTQTIEIFQGSSGKTVILTEEHEVDKIVNEFNSKEFKRIKNSNIEGYSFELKFLDNSGNKLNVVTVYETDEIKVDGKMYKTDSPLNLSLIDCFVPH